MKIKIYRALAILLIICSFSGCQYSKNETSKTTKNEHYTFSITSNQSDENAGKSASFQYLKDKFNVDFKLYYFTENDWSQKVRIWMAAGDMPDIMEASVNNQNYNEYLSWISQGLLRELPDVSKYPNLWKMKQNCPPDKYFQKDGKSYAWVSYTQNEGFDMPASYGYLYRYDWAEKLGKAKEVYTWNEFLDIAREFKKMQSANMRFVPITMDAGLFPYGAGMMQYSPYWEQYVLRDNQYTWGMDLPETLAGIKAANSLYNEGLLAKEQAIYKANEATNKFKIGEAGILMSNTSSYAIGDIYKNFEATFPEVKAKDCIRIMKVLAPDGRMWGQLGLGIGYSTMFNPSLSNDQMDRIFKIFDWIASDEGKDSIIYGVEGADHTVVDGKKEFVNKDMSINGGNPLYAKAMVLNVATPKVINETYYGTDAVNESDNYIQFLKQDMSAYRRYDYNLYFFNGENYSKYGSFFFDGSELIKRLIVGSPDTLEQEWSNWKDSVRPKVNTVLQELNSSCKQD